MLTLIIILAIISQLLVSLFVLLRGRRNISNYFFFLIGVTTMAWAVTNYFTITLLTSPQLIVIVRLILFFVVLQNAAFYLFARTFPSPQWKHSKRNLAIYLVFTAFTAVMTLTPFVFTAVEVNDNLAITEAGPAILIFMLHAAFSISLAFKSLIEKAKKAKGDKKNQLLILLFASFLTWVIVPITNFAITPLLKTTFFIVLSPVYTLLFASIIAYAIVAQKLFDIKLIVARSVAYLSSIGLLVVGYAIITSTVADRVFGAPSDSFISLAANATGFLAAVLIYPYIKNFFDHYTNKIFYKDIYDSNELLDNLNSLLVGALELKSIALGTSSLFTATIKAEYSAIYLSGNHAEARLFTKHKQLLSLVDIEHLEDWMIDKNILSINIDDAVNHHISNLMHANKIAAVFRLRTHTDGIGLLILGNKLSGDSYSLPDLQVLEIASGEIAIALQNAIRYEEIQHFNETLQEEVEDATKRLRSTNAKLRSLDETKDEFISMASHQLRTPLTSIKGYISMVLEGDAGKLNEQQKKMLSQAFVSSQRMNYLISDLLNVSRLKTGKFIIENKPTNLTEVIQGELDQLYDTAKVRGLDLIFEPPKDFPVLNLDETKIRQVIMNFVDNAIYYTPPGGQITIDLSTTDKSVELKVIDTGLGVPKKEQHNLFSKFYRADNARRARPDGTGLGLFMAKKVVIAQGGAIIFKSQEGKGSTFGFSFPRSKVTV